LPFLQCRITVPRTWLMEGYGFTGAVHHCEERIMKLETLYDMAHLARPVDTEKMVRDVLRNSHAEPSELLHDLLSDDQSQSR
jgi:hypothetical protein